MIPFLKWAGGKRWLAACHVDLFPDTFDRYVEPFLGSAAVFFRLGPGNAVLSDANPELIATYRAIQRKHRLVYRYLKEHQARHSKEHYYLTRAMSPRSLYKRAARFIYLNRTCWNALYRVNRNGQFNVPIGTKSSVLLPTDDFAQTAQMLNGAKILASDFEKVIANTGPRDFLFVDPPYTVKHNFNGFIKYNETIFSWADQIRLRESLLAASDRGAKILLTNANHESVRDIYWESFSVREVERKSVIAASSENRGPITELVFSNF